MDVTKRMNTIDWNRHGTVGRPRFVGGAVVGGKVAVVSGSDLSAVLQEAWRKFEMSVLPLNAPATWNVIHCRFNFSAGGLTICAGRAGQLQHEGTGEVYLITGNFSEVWRRAAKLDAGDAGSEFRAAIERAQSLYASAVMNAAKSAVPRLAGVAVMISSVGTPRLVWSVLGSAECSDDQPKDLAVVAPVAPHSGLSWVQTSDRPGNVAFLGHQHGILDDLALERAAVSLWSVFGEKVLPLNRRDSWDCIRCEFYLHESRLVTYVARSPYKQRVDNGTCTLKLENFLRAWRDYEVSLDINTLRRREKDWCRRFSAAATASIRAKTTPLPEGATLQFWERSDEFLQNFVVER